MTFSTCYRTAYNVSEVNHLAYFNLNKHNAVERKRGLFNWTKERGTAKCSGLGIPL